MFLLFLPIWLWPLLSGPQKVFGRAGPSWGTDEKCCVTAELFGDHLWKLSCHCLCSEANNSPHHIWKKHLKSWVMSCGFICFAERGRESLWKGFHSFDSHLRQKDRNFIHAEYSSLKRWKKFWHAGCKNPFWWLFVSCFCLAGWHQPVYPGCSQATSTGGPSGNPWARLRQQVQDILSIHRGFKKINTIYLQAHNGWDTHLVPGWFHESPQMFEVTLCVLSCRSILRRGWAPWLREKIWSPLYSYISQRRH